MKWLAAGVVLWFTAIWLLLRLFPTRVPFDDSDLDPAYPPTPDDRDELFPRPPSRN